MEEGQKKDLLNSIKLSIDEVRENLKKNQEKQRIICESLNLIQKSRCISNPFIETDKIDRTRIWDKDVEHFQNGARIPCSDAKIFHKCAPIWTPEDDKMLQSAMKAEVLQCKLNNEEKKESDLEVVENFETENVDEHITRAMWHDLSDTGVWARIGIAMKRDKFNVRTRYFFLTQNFIPASEINREKLFKKLKRGTPEKYTLEQWRNIAKQLSTKDKNVDTYDIMSIYFQKKRKTMIGFTRKKDVILRGLVAKHGENNNWSVICQEFNEIIRDDQTISEEKKTFADPCHLMIRWEQNLDKKRGSWTDEESIRLMFARELYKGCKNLDKQFEWKRIGNHIAGRSSGQCRERYTKVLYNPNKFQKKGETVVQGIVIKNLGVNSKKRKRKITFESFNKTSKRSRTSSSIRPVKRKRTKKSSAVSRRKKRK